MTRTTSMTDPDRLPEYTNIRLLPIPPYNPLNALDASIKLATPCQRCGAAEGEPCRKACFRPSPVGPREYRVMPADDYDPNPDVHPPKANQDIRRVL